MELIPKFFLRELILSFLIKQMLIYNNIVVELLVAKELGTEKVHNRRLFCNVHPCLMFNQVIVKHWSLIEHAIGHDKNICKFSCECHNNCW